jgi:hypothetical protein
MPTDVMPAKVKHAAQSLYRLIKQHVPTEAQAGDVESYIMLASALADRIRADWDRLLVQLRDGMGAETVRTIATDLSMAADTWCELAQSLQDMAARLAGQTGKPIQRILELADEAVRTGEIRAAARTVVDSVNAADNLPFDEDTLKQSEADFAAGRLQKGKDVIARLRSRKSP